MESAAKVQQPVRHSTIEKFGLEAVPKELRKTSWYDYFILQVSFSVNSGNFLVPALAVLNGGLSFLSAVLATVIGAAAAFFFVSLLTFPGSKNGIPAQYAIRSMLGTFTARYIASPIRSLTSLYWFSVQTIGGTIVLIELGKRVFNFELSFLPVAITLAILMSVLALVGFEAVKKATKYFMPFLIIGQIVLFVLFIQEANNIASSQPILELQGSVKTFFFYSSLAFVQYVSGVSASSDMARYARSSKGAFWGLFSGNTFGFLLTALLGALSASLLGEWNPFVSASTLTSSYVVLFLIFICVFVSMISINLNNAYTGGFSLLNTFQGLGRVKSALVFGVFAVVLSCFPTLVNEAQNYISLLGTLVIPISAVIVSDFIIVKKCQLTEEDIEGLIRSNRLSINKLAILAIVFGALLYGLLPKSLSPGFISFVATSIFYVVASIIKKINKH
ncbi:cytosine permease [Bacillus sp. 31A1R]|uniref:Cytosine permease n=1 Tax=Robertmurraya mangrovi TaxID=3098077 RepID=A0ABU5IZB0_9BACI|nr:cytosine permease [Bacillus sp. 31A1R]MDZ5472505.1 cytosine permease [Bacillus sp. 31A1R]